MTDAARFVVETATVPTRDDLLAWLSFRPVFFPEGADADAPPWHLGARRLAVAGVRVDAAADGCVVHVDGLGSLDDWIGARDVALGLARATGATVRLGDGERLDAGAFAARFHDRALRDLARAAAAAALASGDVLRFDGVHRGCAVGPRSATSSGGDPDVLLARLRGLQWPDDVEGPHGYPRFRPATVGDHDGVPTVFLSPGPTLVPLADDYVLMDLVDRGGGTARIGRDALLARLPDDAVLWLDDAHFLLGHADTVAWQRLVDAARELAAGVTGELLPMLLPPDAAIDRVVLVRPLTGMLADGPKLAYARAGAAGPVLAEVGARRIVDLETEALRNLRALPWAWRPVGGAAGVLAVEGPSAAERVLDPVVVGGALEALATRRIVVAVPARGVLLAAPATDAGVDALTAEARARHDGAGTGDRLWPGVLAVDDEGQVVGAHRRRPPTTAPRTSPLPGSSTLADRHRSRAYNGIELVVALLVLGTFVTLVITLVAGLLYR